MIKRLFDIFGALIGLLFLSPLFLVISLLIKVTDRGPVFFRQERIGQRGRPFKIWKFRTMVVDAEQQGGLLTIDNDPRITRVDSFLRFAKLDELPQLINVLLGQMSLVGPRPEVSKYVSIYTEEQKRVLELRPGITDPAYTEEQKRVLELRPGITDPASIKYRHESFLLSKNADSERVYIEKIMPEKIMLNIDYFLQRSLRRDILIILLTIFRLIPYRKTSRNEKLADKHTPPINL